MPSIIVPTKSSAHRLACLSLYHALLKQCHRFPEAATRSTLQKLVRYRFENDRKIQSTSKITNALGFGRHGLHLLETAADGSHDALGVLTQIISSAAERLQASRTIRAHQNAQRSPTTPSKLARVKHTQHVATKKNQVRKPDTVPVLERPVPLSQIPDGKRRVPVLAVAMGMPFLRYGKPQPANLSRVLRQLGHADEKRWGLRAKIDHQIQMARYEDEWDLHIEKSMGSKRQDHNVVMEGRTFQVERSIDQVRSEGEPSWTYELQQTEAELMARIHGKAVGQAELARKMYEVVVKERQLAAKEKEQARIARRRDRRQQQTVTVEQSVNGRRAADT